MHNLPYEVLVTKSLLQRFMQEAEFEDGPPVYWALLVTNDGKPIEHGADLFTISQDQRMFAMDMVPAVNRHLHHDGAWVIVFTHPPKNRPAIQVGGLTYTRFTWLWMDRDGDVQFPVMFERPFDQYLREGPDPMFEVLEEAWEKNVLIRGMLGVKPANEYKKAQGEVAPSVKDPSLRGKS